jgi:pyruvate dehydrogenase E1 component alpha subunit
MDDPESMYRTYEEVQRMRSIHDPIRGLQRYIKDGDIATSQELKRLDKEAEAEVDAAVAEAKRSPEPRTVDLWSDIYSKGNEPPFMRGREREEVSLFRCDFRNLKNSLSSRFTVISHWMVCDLS